MGRAVGVEIQQKWTELGPQIIKMARQEVDNHWIQDLLADIPDDLPEGGCTVPTY